jgi:MYXO-CTERM domain-containing protein
MATNPNDTHARKAIGKFARALLATTCLTVASGAAVAGTITYTEGNSPAPSDFSNNFAGSSVSALTAATASGTTIVNGEVTGGDRFDYIELTGLGTGTFTVDAVDTEGSIAGADVTIFNLGQTSLGGPTGFNTTVHADFASQAIPVNGDLVIEIESLGESTSFYTVTVDTTASAPEPGTLLTAGLGLAGAVALTRRRRKQS